MTIIHFAVVGEPKAQPRPRAFARAFNVGGKTVTRARVYDAGTAEAWKSEIALAARQHIPSEPLTGPLSLRVDFILPRCKGHYRTGKNIGQLRESAPSYHTGKPDLDNLIKAVKDCLTQLRIWHDDAQVCNEHVWKRYGPVPGALIAVETIDPQTKGGA